MADVLVGRFALIDLIAQGGSGAVWRAWDSKAGQLCAAKVLRQRDSADLMRFVREKGVSFDHPHLLTPYGWGAEDEHVVIAMPLATGGTLDGVIRRHGPLAEPAVVVVLDQLLDGLAHVHAEGWIHRDVKPANIMFEPLGRARPVSRLADFGIAVHSTDVRFTHVGMVNGTPGFMAPELFSMAEPAPSHDLYAAGVVALVALNGRIPLHDGAFRPEELEQYLHGVSPALTRVLRGLLAARPEDRYQDAASVRRDLPRVAADQPLTHADGTALDLPDTLEPLPADAPGAPERPAPHVDPASLEAIRSGRVPQGFTTGPASPSPAPQLAGDPAPTRASFSYSSAPRPGAQLEPAPAGAGPAGAGSPGAGSAGSSPSGAALPGPASSSSVPFGSAPSPTPGAWAGAAAEGEPASSRHSTLIAIGVGVGAALVLGTLVALVLVLLLG